MPELVKLAGDEITVFLGNEPVNFTDQGGFADTSGSRDQHHLGRSLADSLQGGFQSCDFILPAVKPRGDLQFFRHFMATQWKVGQAPLIFELLHTCQQIGCQTRVTLVARLGTLGHQFHNQAGKPLGTCGATWSRGTGCRAM